MSDFERDVANTAIAGLRMKSFKTRWLSGPSAAPTVEFLPAVAFDVQHAVQAVTFRIALERAIVAEVFCATQTKM